MRHFRTQNGRLWMVSPARTRDSGPVLRFTSADGVSFDLLDYPDNWADLTEEALGGLLKQAAIETARDSLGDSTRM